MRVTIDAATLAAAIKRSAAERRATTLPILGFVLITCEPDGDAITVHGTDLQAWTWSTIDATVTDAGSAVLRVDQLLALASRLEGPVRIEDGTLRSGRGRWRIDTLQPTEFPAPMDFPSWQGIGIAPDRLRRAVAAVEYAAGKNDGRYYFNSVAFREGGVVSTDGHRIATVTDESLTLPASKLTVIVPIAHVPSVLSALDGSNDNTQLTVGYNTNDPSPRCVQIESGRDRLRLGLIDAKYPDIQHVTAPVIDACEPGSDRLTFQAFVDRTEMAEAIRRLMVVAPRDTKSHTCPVTLTLAEDGVSIAPLRSDQCDSAEAVPLREGTAQRGSITLRLNAYYLLDALQALTTETAVILCGDGTSDRVLIEGYTDDLDTPALDAAHIIAGVRG